MRSEEDKEGRIATATETFQSTKQMILWAIQTVTTAQLCKS
jgi:hypothetical protein